MPHDVCELFEEGSIDLERPDELFSVLLHEIVLGEAVFLFTPVEVKHLLVLLEHPHVNL